MDFFFNALKGQVNSMNLILFTVFLSFVFHKLNRKKSGTILGIFAFVVLMLLSTDYLPRFLVKRMESSYPPFEARRFPSEATRLYIQVLGGGYTLDKRLPPQAQLSQVGLGRLAEAIRIFHLFDSSILVLSGNIASGDESVASVARKAAISLGVDPHRIVMLAGPSTTLEEAKTFARRFGQTAPVVVVTDAVHMPRAVRFFRNEGIQPYAAPTNYLVKEDDDPHAFRWIPSADNLLLMDRVWREFFGYIKGVV